MAKTFSPFKTWLASNTLTSNQVNVSNVATTTTTTAVIPAGTNTIGTVLQGANSTLNMACMHGHFSNCSTCASLTGQGTIGGLQVGTIGGLQVGAQGHLTVGGHTVQLPQPLSQAEQAELDSLKEQFEAETKAIKKQKFRELHPELRQMVIAILMWNEKSTEISLVQADKTDRMKELEARQGFNQHFGGGGGVTLVE